MTLIARLLLLIAIAAALMLLPAGPGTRLDFWEFGFGFTLMRWALYLGAGSAILALLLVLIPRTRKGSAGALTMTLIIGLATAAVPLILVQQARSLPRIHDISTDTLNPPEFIEIAPLSCRRTQNPVDYPGEEVARQQREAYPDILPAEHRHLPRHRVRSCR